MDNKYLNWDKLNQEDGKINWKNNVGFTLFFYFNDEKHCLSILEDCGYTGKSRYVKVQFDNDVIKTIRTNRLKTMEFKKVYYQYTFKYQIGDIVNGLKIIEQVKKKRKKYNWIEKTYKCICTIDSYEFEISENALNRGDGCPICSNHKIIPGVNDVATTHPWMVMYFKDKNESKKYSACSGHKIVCQCPLCGREKSMEIEVLHRYGFRCDFCSDKLSYPNKLMTYALLQLQSKNIITDFKREFSPDWSENYKYDGYFKIGLKSYIIEMDGGFHFNHNTFNNQSCKDVQKHDVIKQKLAESHNITVIRVDCNYRTMSERNDYIVNNLKTALSVYLDVSIINWDECISKSNINLVYEICEKYNSGVSRKELCSEYTWITNTTIGNYLKMGTQCGFCDYDGSYSMNYSMFYLLDASLNIIAKAQSSRKLLSILRTKYSINIPIGTFYKRLNTEFYVANKYLLKADLAY